MKTTSLFSVLAIVMILVAVGSFVDVRAFGPDKPVGLEPFADAVGPTANESVLPSQLENKTAQNSQDPDAIARRDFMRAKLMYTKNLFEGLTLTDFKLVDESVKEIKGITGGEQWVVIDSDEYRQLTAEFNRSVERLEKASRSRNVQATSLRFFQLSSNCIDCHEHLKKAKYEF